MFVISSLLLIVALNLSFKSPSYGLDPCEITEAVAPNSTQLNCEALITQSRDEALAKCSCFRFVVVVVNVVVVVVVVVIIIIRP